MHGAVAAVLLSDAKLENKSNIVTAYMLGGGDSNPIRL